jgi:hypothetical protein
MKALKMKAVQEILVLNNLLQNRAAAPAANPPPTSVLCSETTSFGNIDRVAKMWYDFG